METLSICWLAGCRQRIVRRVERGGGGMLVTGSRHVSEHNTQ